MNHTMHAKHYEEQVGKYLRPPELAIEARRRYRAYVEAHGMLVPYDVGFVCPCMLNNLRWRKCHDRCIGVLKCDFLDHPEVFKDEHGCFVATSQPYTHGGDPEYLKTMLESCLKYANDNDLAFFSSLDLSWHAPGFSILLAFRAEYRADLDESPRWHMTDRQRQRDRKP
jgi:hypothetical protein